MTATRPCAVTNCPADAIRHEQTCGPHRLASTAKDLCLRVGVGGDRCVACRRKFRAEDYVLRAMVEITRRRKPARGYQHALCEPPSKSLSQKKIRESVKPLLEAVNDAS